MASAVAANRNPSDRNADATVHIAQLDDKVTDALLWELMQQAAPVRHVYIPRDRITGSHYGYGFCEFNTAFDAQYASKILNMIQLYGKPIRISQSTVDRRSQDVGANLFVGNLVDEVDEKLLHDAFSAFGPLIDAPYIMRDPLTNQSKLYGFVKFGSFEHSDAAIAAMDGQYICNSPITVQYAFKKDGDSRERHGSQAERILAARAADVRRATNELRLRPNTMFSDRPAPWRMKQRIDVPPVPSVPPALAQPPSHPAYPVGVPPQPMYGYPNQQYPGTGGQTPQWQTNPRTASYRNEQQNAYEYQQQPIPYAPYGAPGQAPAATGHVGWSGKRGFNGAPGDSGNGYRASGQAKGGDVPRQVPDDAPPPP